MLEFVYFFDGDKDHSYHRVSIDIDSKVHLLDTIQDYFLRVLLESPYSSLYVFCYNYAWHITLQGCSFSFQNSFPGLPYIDDGGNIAYSQIPKGGLNE